MTDENEKYKYGKKYKTHLDHEKIAEERNFSKIKSMGVLKDCKKVLVVGCPNKFFLEICKKNGIDAFGIDIDPETVDGKDVVRCDVDNEKFPFGDCEFDLVYSKGLIQHLEKPPINFMKEIGRVTKNGGYIIMLVRNEKSIPNIFGILDNYKHKSTWTPMSVKCLFEAFGLDIIHIAPRFNFTKWYPLLSRLPFKWSLGSTIFIVGKKK